MFDDYVSISLLDDLMQQYSFTLQSGWQDAAIVIDGDGDWNDFVRDFSDGVLGYMVTQGQDVDGDGDVDLRDVANLFRRDSSVAEDANETNPNLVNYLQSEYGPMADSVIGSLADIIDAFQPFETPGPGSNTNTND